MSKNRVASFVAGFMLFAHLGLFPFVLFYATRFNSTDKLDILFIIAPLTTAYLVTTTKFVLEKANSNLSAGKSVNYLYILYAAVIPVAFIGSIYGIVVMMQSGSIVDIELSKRYVGFIEGFIGASFALVMSDMFGSNG